MARILTGASLLGLFVLPLHLLLSGSQSSQLEPDCRDRNGNKVADCNATPPF